MTPWIAARRRVPHSPDVLHDVTGVDLPQTAVLSPQELR